MTGEEPVVWVVASATVSRRWERLLGEAGIAAHALVWGEPAPPPDLPALIRALREAQGQLVLITSRHAMAFLPTDAGRGLQAVCVGPGTAEAADALGFDVVITGRGGAGALAQRVLEERPGTTRVLFLAGRDARHEGPAGLEAGGVEVRTEVAYVMAPRAAFADEVRAAPPPRVVLAGSPRAVDALLDAAERAERGDLATVPFVVPGGVTAAHVAGRLGRPPAVAPAADPGGLIAAVRAQLHNAGE